MDATPLREEWQRGYGCLYDRCLQPMKHFVLSLNVFTFGCCNGLNDFEVNMCNYQRTERLTTPERTSIIHLLRNGLRVYPRNYNLLFSPMIIHAPATSFLFLSCSPVLLPPPLTTPHHPPQRRSIGIISSPQRCLQLSKTTRLPVSKKLSSRVFVLFFCPSFRIP